MTEDILHKGWTSSHLRRGLRLAPAETQRVLRYIAEHPSCTSREIAEGLGLRSERAVGPALRKLTSAVEGMGIRDTDGEFHWPLDLHGRRGNYVLYDMRPRVRAIVLDELGRE